ncbi:PF20097 family protein [Sphingomonas sp. Leaf33]|uniref:PF20097 family protein n=1 Tax=Sphingomonas sp. Leaf33 TaxID=1736215 RepID=UPI000A92A965|nr:PF20097 family protein [Sphingomonas sp. Leaf33]
MKPQGCPRCQGSMMRGFLVEQNASHHYETAHWVEGEPVKSFWSGLKLKGRTRLSVETWRCGRCGFLESYAR